MTITLEYLKECLDYNPETGIFTWKERPREHFRTEIGWKMFNTRDKGKVVGSSTSCGYLQIVVSRGTLIGKHFLAHRVAWLFHHGRWPTHHIDHINGVVWDNRIANLREATNSENMRNMNIPRHNKSGVKGVFWCKAANKWRAEVQHQKKHYHLGVFESLDDADQAARKCREELRGNFLNHGYAHPSKKNAALKT